MNKLHYKDEIAFENFQYLDVKVVPEKKSVWLYFNARPRPCFTLDLLEELNKFQAILGRYQGRLPCAGELVDIDYNITTGKGTTYSLGGDLNFFLKCIENRDRQLLAYYAKSCIDALYANYIGREFDITTIALVRGNALGGGFEAALSAHVMIAEDKAEFGLPEILFNLFPGMGAYNLLAQRLGVVAAEKMVLGGNLYDAGCMHDMGIVDLLVEDGKGIEAVDTYICQNDNKRRTIANIRKIRQSVSPIDYQKLIDIADIWVDSAFNLSSRDMRLIQRLVNAQDRLTVDNDKHASAVMQAF